ncbi:hypothetical protein [Nocardia sp. NPDC060259]
MFDSSRIVDKTPTPSGPGTVPWVQDGPGAGVAGDAGTGAGVSVA